MALIECEACGKVHSFTAENLARLVKEFQAGNMQVVSVDYPYRWVPLAHSTKVTQIRPRCLAEAHGVKAVPPKKRGRPRKDEQRS